MKFLAYFGLLGLVSSQTMFFANYQDIEDRVDEIFDDFEEEQDLLELFSISTTPNGVIQMYHTTNIQ